MHSKQASPTQSSVWRPDEEQTPPNFPAWKNLEGWSSHNGGLDVVALGEKHVALPLPVLMLASLISHKCAGSEGQDDF